ncbi:hypothetical protein RhiJN_24974 [Ceratobasidium sp. AG-Ba]|nr:hypothetical protein RhiJN_24974 [Ceratobasidium sp. AG-Ba]
MSSKPLNRGRFRDSLPQPIQRIFGSQHLAPTSSHDSRSYPSTAIRRSLKDQSFISESRFSESSFSAPVTRNAASMESLPLGSSGSIENEPIGSLMQGQGPTVRKSAQLDRPSSAMGPPRISVNTEHCSEGEPWTDHTNSPSTSVLSDTASIMLKGSLKSLKKAATAVSPFHSVADILITSIDTIPRTAENEVEYKKLASDVSKAINTLETYIPQLNGPLNASARDILSQLQQEADSIALKVKRSTAKRYIDVEHDEEDIMQH